MPETFIDKKKFHLLFSECETVPPCPPTALRQTEPGITGVSPLSGTAGFPTAAIDSLIH